MAMTDTSTISINGSTAYNIPSDIRSADLSPDAPVTGAKGMPNVHPLERVASAAVGMALVGMGGMRRRGIGDAALAATGGYLIYRGVTGQCAGYTALRTGTNSATDSQTATIPHGQGIKVEKTVTINKPASELFAYWRNFENLPRFMQHLEAVEVQDNTRSRWTVKGPMGKNVAWDAEIIAEVPGTMIAWRSTDNADVANAGSVRFTTLPFNRGTAVKVTLEYNPPAGLIGKAIAKMFGEDPEKQVEDDLRHFKQLMETGEIPTNGGRSLLMK